MRLVVIESPYGGSPEIIERNVEYLQLAIRDCILRGESPYASHQMLTQALEDRVPYERNLGIRAGFEWAQRADARVVYADLGVTDGMAAGIEHARRIGQTTEFRRLGRYWRSKLIRLEAAE